ncbi:IclR family transcriptional regulator [Sulfitobacter donghicola]|uniref:IclR family transcriptional regulator n=1 Tax=Sulfitobacter donghicola DSW-25 = KCTC 12864 = JCM 14565 TaxID=1300350 RepID=A0A073IJD9_9RHOB|nr:IclR family transcriptional regulator [Sulfitobacter donghicola]KEJ89700.1 IclR family transcriptional regulator [Sulfitobacter donghicola DSW-25 = KCTC 12864 = JCM 14565]
MAEQNTDRKFATTLARGLAVLRVFRASDNGLTHAQIAERTGLPKPTISRLTYTLCELGYLSHGSRNDRFRLGPASMVLGSVASVAVNFVDRVSDDMQRLADETGTLALIAVRDGDRMMLVRTWRPATASTIWLEPGHRIPLHGSSSGMAFLAALDAERFEALEPDEQMRKFRQDGYDQLVGKGFLIASEETRYASTINAVSVPYYAAEFGEAVAFTCGATPQELPQERMTNDVGPALHALVQNLEQRTGRIPALSRR